MLNENADSSYSSRPEKLEYGVGGHAETTVTVVSSDLVWARLLALNLTKRGYSASPRTELNTKEMASRDWLILDVNELELDCRSFVKQLRNTNIAIALDTDLAPSHEFETDADVIVEKTADMRVMARSILDAFEAAPIDRELRKLKISW